MRHDERVHTQICDALDLEALIAPEVVVCPYAHNCVVHLACLYSPRSCQLISGDTLEDSIPVLPRLPAQEQGLQL
jgi:hypothetical protein